MHLLRGFPALLMTAAGAASAAADPLDDSLFKSAADVNEGDLVFLPVPPAKKVHHHQNALTITESSLADGWADMRQCHRNLDKVPRAQIVFKPQRIRELVITEAKNVGEAWVDGVTVQLRNVGEDAVLCLTAKSRALTDNGDGSYTVKSGPFMRKFLDGYYPMHVSMNLRVTTDRLRVAYVSPEQQTGFVVNQNPCGLDFDAWFEGRLNTEVTLMAKPPD